LSSDDFQQAYVGATEITKPINTAQLCSIIADAVVA
jgi:hypothetical protein